MRAGEIGYTEPEGMRTYGDVGRRCIKSRLASTGQDRILREYLIPQRPEPKPTAGPEPKPDKPLTPDPHAGPARRVYGLSCRRSFRQLFDSFFSWTGPTRGAGSTAHGPARPQRRAHARVQSSARWAAVRCASLLPSFPRRARQAIGWYCARPVTPGFASLLGVLPLATLGCGFASLLGGLLGEPDTPSVALGRGAGDAP